MFYKVFLQFVFQDVTFDPYFHNKSQSRLREAELLNGVFCIPVGQQITAREDNKNYPKPGHVAECLSREYDSITQR